MEHQPLSPEGNSTTLTRIDPLPIPSRGWERVVLSITDTVIECLLLPRHHASPASLNPVPFRHRLRMPFVVPRSQGGSRRVGKNRLWCSEAKDRAVCFGSARNPCYATYYHACFLYMSLHICFKLVPSRSPLPSTRPAATSTLLPRPQRPPDCRAPTI